MSYSDLIHEYLDGSLEGAEEETLFGSLAGDPELRNEFNQQMKIHLIASADMNAIAPPGFVTANIFSRLGFAMPGGAESSDPEAALPVTATPFWKKHMSTLLIALLAASLTTGIFIAYDQFKGSSSAGNGQNQGIPIVSSYEQNGSPAVNKADASDNDGSPALFSSAFSNVSREDYARSEEEVARLRALVKTLAGRNKSSNDANRTLASAGDSPESTANLSLNNNRSSNNQMLINPVLVVEGRLPSALRSPAANTLYPVRIGSVQKGLGYTRMELIDAIDNSHYIVQVKGILPQTATPDVSLASRDKNALNNLGFSVYYKLNGSNALGAEFGWEAFPQQFKHNIEGIVHNQKQAPILFWYGASYRYSADRLLFNGIINPFAVATIGGTTAGPLLRGQLGLEFNPYSNIGFIISGDFSNLFYNVDGKIYNTSKTGLAYGVSFKF